MYCEHCHTPHDGSYGSGRFCKAECARAFSTSKRRREINRKVSAKLSGRSLTDEHKAKIGEARRGQRGRILSEQGKANMSVAMKKAWAEGKLTGLTPRKPRRITSIYEASHRTRLKIIRRLALPCSQCGWSEAHCDTHHIRGRKVADPHNHRNLCLLCPNCHRLAHIGKIKPEDLTTLEDYLPKDWADLYYG